MNHIENTSGISPKTFIDGSGKCCEGPIYIALLVIGICTAAGALNGVVAGGCAIGLIVPLLLANIMVGPQDTAQQQCDRECATKTLINLALMIIGTLAHVGVLGAVGAGSAILSVAFVALIVSCVKCRCWDGFEKCLEFGHMVIPSPDFDS